jgi:hypothetical protein
VELIRTQGSQPEETPAMSLPMTKCRLFRHALKPPKPGRELWTWKKNQRTKNQQKDDRKIPKREMRTAQAFSALPTGSERVIHRGR